VREKKKGKKREVVLKGDWPARLAKQQKAGKKKATKGDQDPKKDSKINCPEKEEVKRGTITSVSPVCFVAIGSKRKQQTGEGGGKYMKTHSKDEALQTAAEEGVAGGYVTFAKDFSGREQSW